MSVLFICVANSARSQMAEGLWRHAHPEIACFSAGSDPSGRVHPMAIEAMREIGIDIRAHRSKPFADVPINNVQLVVGLCAEEHCPAIAREMIHAPIADPAGFSDDFRRELALEGFRDARDEIKKLIETLVANHFT